MSYTPTTWVTGDTVTPEKLNKIEQGIYDAGGSTASAFVVDAYDDNGVCTLQETAGNIINAYTSGTPVIIQTRDPVTGNIGYARSLIHAVYMIPGQRYSFEADNFVVCYASSLDEYPTGDGGGE